MGELKDRTALVTGASRGIGAAIAAAMARAGAAVAINFRERGDEAESVRRRIVEAGGRAAVFQADVSIGREVLRLAGEVESVLGPVGVLVNNAGIARRQPVAEITEADWDDILTVNLKSCFLMTQAVLPGMRARRWGRIVNVSSVAAQTGGVVGPHYAASKAGIHGLTHSYAGLLAKEGITANAIAPALIETEMVTANLAARPELIPVGRFGTVEEVASIAVLLAENGYITGQTINANGGWYMS